ncbi:MAG: transcription initiation factor IIB [Conexivisphaera sp.]|jgi:transcription initiation factor TFIIB
MREVNTCKICGERLIFDPESGEYVCPNGHVSTDRAVEEGRSWSAVDLEDVMRRSQAGGPIRLSDPNPLSTLIGKSGDDSWRLRRAQRIVDEDSDLRRRTRVMELMKEAASKLSLPDNFVEDAARIYLKLEKDEAVRGRRLAPLAVALLYYVSRARGIGRSLEEFLEAGSAWGISRKSMKRSVREYYLNLRGMNGEEGEDAAPTRINVVSYISKLASQLGISPRTEALAKEIAGQMGYEPLMGRNPRGIAIALLSMAGNIMNEDIRQGDLSGASDISTVTLRKRKREILDSFTLEVIPKAVQ